MVSKMLQKPDYLPNLSIDKECKISVSGTVKYFDADNVDDPSKELTVPAEPQSKCEISMQYMKCLAAAEKQSDCPVFTFP
ncbi:unnamed protein product [Acanthoscelides obtectus]|uniref:Uncharacterized protein n=1 Tax=Acanthoscelides obtectus TaxID=200917 RepID=A0A9P0P5Q1_ACAOB|nr:unnamed protein product [Acanthoscelides obtectus]CAK1622844.1 hypothetical protein AOBTE_LOCUS1695 [Acanthoscelides obtectus]